jgi:hypothetical protein
MVKYRFRTEPLSNVTAAIIKVLIRMAIRAYSIDVVPFLFLKRISSFFMPNLPSSIFNEFYNINVKKLQNETKWNNQNLRLEILKVGCLYGDSFVSFMRLRKNIE